MDVIGKFNYLFEKQFNTHIFSSQNKFEIKILTSLEHKGASSVNQNSEEFLEDMKQMGQMENKAGHCRIAFDSKQAKGENMEE